MHIHSTYMYLVLVINTAIVVALLDHKVDRWSIMKIFLHAVEIWHQVGVLEREVREGRIQ